MSHLSETPAPVVREDNYSAAFRKSEDEEQSDMLRKAMAERHNAACERETVRIGRNALIFFLVGLATLVFLVTLAKFGDVPDKGNNPYATTQEGQY